MSRRLMPRGTDAAARAADAPGGLFDNRDFVKLFAAQLAQVLGGGADRFTT